MNQAGYLLLQALAGVTAIFALAYFTFLTVRVGVQFFHFFFLAVSVFLAFFMLLGALSHRGIVHIPRPLLRLFAVCILLGVLVFCWLFGLIIHGQSQSAAPNADYVIVLGAGLRGEKPSLVLQHRIDAAAQYLLDNPDSRVIVSGGQGLGEVIPEALSMQRALIEQGIDEERILMEDKSTDTVENMRFSLKYIRPQDEVVIVTNKFHIYRALHIAKECGYEKVSGCGADNVVWLNPNNYIRECLAVIKDVVL